VGLRPAFVDNFHAASYLADMSEPASPPNAVTIWLKRIAVWSITIVVVVWAARSIYRVFAHGPTTGSPPGVAHRVIPRSTGEDPHQKARAELNDARKVLRSGDLAGGIQRLQQVLQDDPQSPQARQAMLVLAGTYRFMAHDPQKALATYTDFIERFPDDPQVTKVVGYLHELYAETNARDETDFLLRGVLPRLENNPEAYERVKKLSK
jgi:hypothetical protein